MGIALGAGIGVALGVATRNPGLWISLGLVLGIAIGGGLDRKQKARQQDGSESD